MKQSLVTLEAWVKEPAGPGSAWFVWGRHFSNKPWINNRKASKVKRCRGAKGQKVGAGCTRICFKSNSMFWLCNRHSFLEKCCHLCRKTRAQGCLRVTETVAPTRLVRAEMTKKSKVSVTLNNKDLFLVYAHVPGKSVAGFWRSQTPKGPGNQDDSILWDGREDWRIEDQQWHALTRKWHVPLPYTFQWLDPVTWDGEHP